MKANGTWGLIIRPPGQEILHSKWSVKTKKHADGTLEGFRARLVACGNELAFEMDSTLAFIAVMDMTTAKVVLALARVWLGTAISQTLT